jgi:hypothetical protein
LAVFLPTEYCFPQITVGCRLTPLKKSRFDFFGKEEKIS